MNSDRRLVWFHATLAPILLWSWHEPRDIPTWWLEASPVLIGVVLILLTRRCLPLSSLLLAGIWLHSVILLVGAHYTYAEVPFFEGLGEWRGSSRNNYDKLGHFAQGFFPAILTREILLRRSSLGRTGEATPSAWLPFLTGCVCLAFSAFYELIEWAVALAFGDGSEAFLGTQGYEWDTQSDMGMALLGAVMALAFFSRWHDRSLRSLDLPPSPHTP